MKPSAISGAFGRALKEHRAARGLSLSGLQALCGVDKTVLSRIETGKFMPKGEPLRAILGKGFGFKESSSEWKEMIGLWTNCRLQRGSFDPQELAGRMAGQMYAQDEQMREFLGHVGKLTTRQFQELAKAVQRPEVVDALEALNRLVDGVKTGK